MLIEKFLLALIVYFHLVTAQSQTLGPNLIINHDFSSPDFLSMGVPVLYFPDYILGWNCSSGYCLVIDCYRFNLWAQSENSSLLASDCPSQAICTSSTGIDVISQIFEANAGQHILDIKFPVPLTLASSKILVIMINQRIVYKFHPLYQEFAYKEASIVIILQEGENKISLTTEGTNDPLGYRIFEIKIRRKIQSQATKAIQILTNNAILSNSISIPGSRILFGELINTMISFDRMQLYYYHHRRYSYYYDTFLKGITDLLNQKGTYASYISDEFFQSIGTSQQSVINNLNFKKDRKYKDNHENINFMQNGGFFFVVSFIPITIIMFFCFNMVFRLTFDNKFSKIFRKYSFFSLILLMLFQGNIQQFSFLIVNQFLEYFSACFSHKVVNILIMVVFYLIVFCSTAIYLYSWQIHKKKMSYLTDNIALKMKGMIAYTFDRGIICLLCGLIHRLTLLCGKQQLLILAALQCILIVFKIICLLLNSYKCKILGWISIFEGFARVCFQISIFMYENSVDQRGFINEQVHLKITYIFFFLWALNLILSVIQVIKSMLQTVPKTNSQKINVRKQHISKMKKQSSLRYNHAKGVSKKKDKAVNIRIMGKMKRIYIRMPQSV